MKKRMLTVLLAGTILMTAGFDTKPTLIAPQDAAAGETYDTEGRRDLDPAQTLEVLHRMYQANRREAVLQNHSSVSYHFRNSYPAYAGFATDYYITPEMQYMEGEDWTTLQEGRIIYQMSDITDPENARMLYNFDLRKDPTADLYSYSPETEEMWFDPEHESFLEAFENDGMIFLYSKYDAALSEWFANNVGEDYTGQNYYMKAIISADTYEILVAYTLCGNDAEQKVEEIFTAEYGLAEPKLCTMMHAAFERNTLYTVQVGMVMNPDTEQEYSVFAEIPANSDVVYIVDDLDNTEKFHDRECTQPITERWDRVTDKVFYFREK